MEYIAVRPSTTAERIRAVSQGKGQEVFPVVAPDEQYLGLLFVDDLDEFPSAATAQDILEAVQKSGETRNIYIYSRDSVDDARLKLRQKRLPFLPVIDYGHHYIGTIDGSST